MNTPTLPTLCGSMAAKPSPFGYAMHNAAYRALNMPYVFVPFQVDDSAGAIQAIRTLRMRGMNVSMPFKVDVLKYLDELTPAARAIGAVNTIINNSGKLIGDNTDWYGARMALEEKILLKEKNIAVLGAGGAARAVVYGLSEAGAKLTIFNRSLAGAQNLADQFHQKCGGTLQQIKPEYFDCLVNTTSVGFHDSDSSPVTAKFGEQSSKLIVMDIVFMPLETRLLRDASLAGATVIPGTRMLLHQAMRQIELYTGLTAPADVMERALKDVLLGLETPD